MIENTTETIAEVAAETATKSISIDPTVLLGGIVFGSWLGSSSNAKRAARKVQIAGEKQADRHAKECEREFVLSLSPAGQKAYFAAAGEAAERIDAIAARESHRDLRRAAANAALILPTQAYAAWKGWGIGARVGAAISILSGVRNLEAMYAYYEDRPRLPASAVTPVDEGAVEAFRETQAA